MGILVYSLLWIMQDFVHEPYYPSCISQRPFAKEHQETLRSPARSEPKEPEIHISLNKSFRKTGPKQRCLCIYIDIYIYI